MNNAIRSSTVTGLNPVKSDNHPWSWSIMVMAVLIVGILFGLAASTPAHPFDFRFNWFALLPLVAVVISIGSFMLISRVGVRTESLAWFALFLFSLAVWSSAEGLQRLSATPQAAGFWAAAASIGAFFMPSALYMFALAYTNPQRARRPLVFVPVVLMTLFLLFFDFRTMLLSRYSVDAVTLKPWGYMFEAGVAYILMVMWIYFLLVNASLLYARFFRQTLDRDMRQQAKLFVIASMIPLAAGFLTDGILPIAGMWVLPPLGAFLTSVMALLISYGILHYRFFTFSPELVASNVLSTMNEAVIGTTPDFKITYANPGAERLLGYTAPQFARRRLTDFLSQSLTLAQLRRTVVETLQQRDFGTFDSVDLRKSDGTMMTAKLSLTKLMEGDRLQGYLAVITDITKLAQTTQIIEQEVMERTEEVQHTKSQLVSSINSLELGFLMLDARPEVIMVNNVAHRLFCHEWRRHTAVTCRAITLITVYEQLKGAVNLPRQVNSCMEHQRPREIKDVVFADRNWRLYLSPMIDDGHSTGCAMLWQDVTRERLLERSRDEFFSIASHELRTPLTAIKGNASLMLQYYKKILHDPQLKEMVDDIHDSSERLISIVNDFLDASRLEQKKINFEIQELALSEVLESVAYEMGALLQQRGLYLHMGHELTVHGKLPNILADRNRLKQIVFNLLGNAAKFTETGGITVSARVSGERMSILVADTGRGMDPKHQALLFHKFQQLSGGSLTRDVSQGTGLGLYISRLLARGMGGDLGLRSSVPGIGSTFELVLPIVTPARLKRLSREVS